MIDAKKIEEIVYGLCVEANTVLPEDVFDKILNAYETETNEDAKQALGLILTNAQMAAEKKMPLCQDTGQVLVFVKGRNIPASINEIINKTIEKAYKENYFRQSVVKNALFDRANTKTNTPCIIYTEVADCELEIELLLKGGGSENVCATQMLSPTASEDEIVDFIVSVVKKAGSKACPPYFIGVGIGGTMEYAGILSKKALLLEENVDENHKNLAKKIQAAVNALGIGAVGLGGASTALDVKIITDFTHIACMPVSVTLNCHSMRHAKWKGKGKREKEREYPSPEFQVLLPRTEILPSPTRGEGTNPPFTIHNSSFTLSVHSSDINALKAIKQGENILLSGEIYTARDMAHKRLLEMMKKGEKLPFELKDKIIFYAGPCPCSENCVVGSIGPTTSSRMDKFAPVFYKKGILATIGKGERSQEVQDTIKETGGLYFTVIGGIACYLSEKFKKKELIAFEDLGAEAIYKFEVENLPLRLDLS